MFPQGLLQLCKDLPVSGLFLLIGGQVYRQGSGDLLLITAVKKGEEAVVLALGDRIVLMGVALSAAYRQSQPDAAGGVQSIDNGLDPKLLLVRPALGTRQGVAMKTCRDLLLDAGILQQITRQLFTGKPIKRKVTIEGIDHPVTISPGKRTNPIFLVAIAVGVARQVQPVPPPALAEMGRSQHPPDQVLPGLRALVLDKPAHLLRLRQQAGQVQAQAADKGVPVSLRRRSKTLHFHPGQDEPIDRIAGPGVPLDHRRLGFLYRPEGPEPRRGGSLAAKLPVAGPGQALINPASQHADLDSGQSLVLLPGRHDQLTQGGDRVNQPASRAVAGDDDRAIVPTGQQLFSPMKPQASLGLLLTMAPYAAQQKWLDLALEIDLFGHGGSQLRQIRLLAFFTADGSSESAEQAIRPQRTKSIPGVSCLAIHVVKKEKF